VSPSPAAIPVPHAEADCRCLCGSLLARVVDGGVELKCRRCKRTVFVPMASPATGRFRPVRAVSPGERE
jgi:phage FluMu protein Com